MANQTSPYQGSHFTAVSVGQLGASANYTKGTPLTYWERGTVTVNPGAITTGAELDYAMTVANAAVGDSLVMNPPAGGASAGLEVTSAWVDSAGTIKMRLRNNTGSTLTPASATWTYLLIRS